MLGTAIDLQLLGHGAAEPVLGKHALHRPLDHALGMLVEHLLGGNFLETADVAGVPAVELVLELAPGEMDLRGVEHDDVIADVQMRDEACLVFASEDRRHLRGQAPSTCPSASTTYHLRSISLIT